MGKDEKAINVQLNCRGIEHPFKGNYISNFDIIIASEMRINRSLFFFVVVGIFILFLKMYGLCQRSSLGIPTQFNVTNLNF